MNCGHRGVDRGQTQPVGRDPDEMRKRQQDGRPRAGLRRVAGGLRRGRQPGRDRLLRAEVHGRGRWVHRSPAPSGLPAADGDEVRGAGLRRFAHERGEFRGSDRNPQELR